MNDTGKFLSRKKLTNTVYSKAQFFAILNRERERCNRKACSFQLVVFNFQRGYRFNPRRRKVVNHLKSRFRSSDVMGWIDDRSFGIILAHATRERAEALARDIDASLPRDRSSYTIRIFTYADGEVPLSYQLTQSRIKYDDMLQSRLSN